MEWGVERKVMKFGELKLLNNSEKMLKIEKFSWNIKICSPKVVWYFDLDKSERVKSADINREKKL